MSGKIRGSKGVQERFLEELFGKSMKILSSVYLKTFKKKKDKPQLLVKNAGFFLAVSRFFLDLGQIKKFGTWTCIIWDFLLTKFCRMSSLEDDLYVRT